MMKRDRVVLKDYLLSILSATGAGLFLSYVVLPLLVMILGGYSGEDLLTLHFFMQGAATSIGAFPVITHIVLGALVVQYMRFYMLMGLSRDRAFFSVMKVEAVALLETFVILFVIGAVSSIFYPVSIGNVAFTALSFVASSVFAFGIGSISSALSTTARPPLSVVIIAAVIIAFLWIGERLVTFTESVVTVGNNISVTFSSLMEGQEIAVFLTLGLVMCALSYLEYKLPISQMKSTSIS